MTLEEILPQYMGQVVQIGTDEGNCFFYCGTCNEYIYELIDEIADDYLEKMRKTRKWIISRVDRWESICTMQRANKINELRQAGKLKDKDKELKKLKHTQECRLKSDKNLIEVYKERLANYTTLLKREVVETYTTTCNKNIKIIIKGFERGNYVSTNEYKYGYYARNGFVKAGRNIEMEA